MSLSGRRSVLALIALLAFARIADAQCMLRQWTSPALGSIPLHGVVFAYTDYYDAGPVAKVAWASGHGTTTVTRVSPTVTRVDYAGSEGAVLRVDNASYTVSAHTLLRIAPRVVAIRREQGQWTCSSNDDLKITLEGSAAGYRARWTRDGVVSEYWIVEKRGAVELGKVNCGGTTLPPSELDEGGRLELFAVSYDGSEHLILDTQQRFEVVREVVSPVVGVGTIQVVTNRDPGSLFVIGWALFALISLGFATPRVADLARRGATELPRARVLP